MATGKYCRQMNPRSSPTESKSVTFTKVFRALGTSTSCHQPLLHTHPFLAGEGQWTRPGCIIMEIISKSLQEVRVLSSLKKHLGHCLRSSKFYKESMASFRLRSQMFLQTETIKCMGENNFWGITQKYVTYIFVFLTTKLGACPQLDENPTSVPCC